MWDFIAEAGPISILCIAAAAAWAVWEVKHAHRCVCNRPDCGGGCGLV